MLTILFTLLTVFSSWAHADDVNLIKNPNFESRTAQWSKTGSSTFTIETAAPLEGNYSANWDASTTGEFLRSSTYTIPDGLKGRTCTIEMTYLWDSGVAGEILMNVDDGTSNVATVSLSPTSGGVSALAATSFSCPSSGTLRFELESTANAASIRLDKTYLGSGKNILQVSQTNFIGSAYIPTTASCTWTRTNTALGAFGTVAACPGPTVISNPGPGVIQTTDSDLPQFTVNSLPAGKYKVTFSGPNGVSAASAIAGLAITDGSITYPAVANGYGTSSGQGGFMLEAWFDYSSAGNRTFSLLGSASTGAINIENDTNNVNLSMSITKFPSSSAETMTLETTGAKISANHGSDCSFAGTTTPTSATGEFAADATCTFTVNDSAGFTGISSYQITNNAPGIVFTAPRAGLAYVSATYSVVQPVGGWSVTMNANGTVISAHTGQGQGSTYRQNGEISGLANIVAGSNTIKLLHGVSSGTLSMTGNTDVRTIQWKVFYVDQQMPAPVFTSLQGNIKAGAENGVKMCAYQVANSGTPTLTQSIPTGCVASLTDNSVGNTTANFAGSYWSTAPICTVTVRDQVDATNANCFIGSSEPSTSSVIVHCESTISAAASDFNHHVVCFGK